MSSSWISSLNARSFVHAGSVAASAGGVRRVPLEHHAAAVVAERDDDVRLHLPHVDVEHHVREEPHVHRFRRRPSSPDRTADRGVAAVHRTQRRVLDGEVAVRLDAVVVVVELLVQPRVHDREVIALEVVVDVDLPVAGDLPLLAHHVAHRTRSGRARRDAGRPRARRAAAAPCRRGSTKTSGPHVATCTGTRCISVGTEALRRPPSRARASACRRARRSSRGSGTGACCACRSPSATGPARWRQTL